MNYPRLLITSLAFTLGLASSARSEGELVRNFIVVDCTGIARSTEQVTSNTARVDLAIRTRSAGEVEVTELNSNQSKTLTVGEELRAEIRDIAAGQWSVCGHDRTPMLEEASFIVRDGSAKNSVAAMALSALGVTGAVIGLSSGSSSGGSGTSPTETLTIASGGQPSATTGARNSAAAPKTSTPSNLPKRSCASADCGLDETPPPLSPIS